MQPIAAQGEAVQRGTESVTPVKVKADAKEAETPATSAPKDGQTEKPERKSRKKKAASANTTEPTNGSASNAGAAPNRNEASRAPVSMPFTSEALDSAVIYDRDFSYVRPIDAVAPVR